MLASLLITNNHYSLCWNFQSTCNENSLISDHWRMARTSTVTSSTCHFEKMYMFTKPAVFLNIVQKVGGGMQLWWRSSPSPSLRSRSPSSSTLPSWSLLPWWRPAWESEGTVLGFERRWRAEGAPPAVIPVGQCKNDLKLFGDIFQDCLRSTCL